ncbi:MAG: hypothetical protein J2P30_12675 [Actinobacteria bacterium]|nr:hypothetical protein [Actinomycetota bacterium]
MAPSGLAIEEACFPLVLPPDVEELPFWWLPADVPPDPLLLLLPELPVEDPPLVPPELLPELLPEPLVTEFTALPAPPTVLLTADVAPDVAPPVTPSTVFLTVPVVEFSVLHSVLVAADSRPPELEQSVFWLAAARLAPVRLMTTPVTPMTSNAAGMTPVRPSRRFRVITSPPLGATAG